VRNGKTLVATHQAHWRDGVKGDCKWLKGGELITVDLKSSRITGLEEGTTAREASYLHLTPWNQWTSIEELKAYLCSFSELKGYYPEISVSRSWPDLISEICCRLSIA